ncbi:hypothetical protein DACRYDRAFT_24635 [Dacryopinax primogenitus]|uniref:BAR domain-containing protein n=1 Tax=Dacryopinax primogenitus (strain DJM 731) TaxID=1858805 RepID=M5FSF7_DACPD|nr:uncharacterized protein DACRYDRAFT_24635 [Dacryopinax primogenitus]EJT98114.1 hypothetical protein DACRYDRAFT_24635 [Dacryopinax primogenitus]
MANSWTKSFSAGLGQINLSSVSSGASRIAKGFNNSVQATRERLGQISPDDITELPAEYKELESRVDALRTTHLALLKITQAYGTETYDYPTQISESVSELSQSVAHNLTAFAATNLKGTNIPAPHVTPAVKVPPKTLNHALSRAAGVGAAVEGPDERLGKALKIYAEVNEKIGDARLQQDHTIRELFLTPWQATLSTSLTVAMKARAAVKQSRLELDAAKQGYYRMKNASPQRQEQARLEVENAEDDLVQKTEVAITLMKTLLDNPEPLKNLNELVKAQLVFHSTAAEALQGIQGDIEELTVAAEGDYRKSRDH